MKKVFFTSQIFLNIICAVSLAQLLGCRTTNNNGNSDEVTPSFTFTEESPVYLSEPLGNFRKIIVQWQNANATTPTEFRYRGWDYNKDTRFDMLEVFAKGEDVASLYIFDFDGDGKIDLVRQKK